MREGKRELGKDQQSDAVRLLGQAELLAFPAKVHRLGSSRAFPTFGRLVRPSSKARRDEIEGRPRDEIEFKLRWMNRKGWEKVAVDLMIFVPCTCQEYRKTFFLAGRYGVGVWLFPPPSPPEIPR